MVLKGKNSGEVVTILVLLVVAVALIWGGWVAIGKAADYMASKVPDSFETKVFGSLGGRQAGWSDQATGGAQKRAQAIYERLLKERKASLRDLDYRFYFVREDVPNAFAMPGGSLAVTDGLLKLVEGDVGLATVIGHEFGHLQHRHGLRALGRNLLIAGIVMVAMGGDVGFIANMALNLADKAHSREQELEADEYGIRMVHAVFGTTEGSLEFFSKLEKDPDTKDSPLMTMLSTHPYTPDRIEKLRELAAALEKSGGGAKGAAGKGKAGPGPRPSQVKAKPSDAAKGATGSAGAQGKGSKAPGKAPGSTGQGEPGKAP